MSFRLRMLLLALVVALPPLVAFGAFALSTTAALSSSHREDAAQAGLQRATQLLARALNEAERALEPIAADRAFLLAAYNGRTDAARTRYAAVGPAGWSAALVSGTGLTLLTPAGTMGPADMAEMVRTAGEGPLRGSLVDDGRLYLVESAPLGTDAGAGANGDGAAIHLVAWRDETEGLWEAMQVASGGTLAIGDTAAPLVLGPRSAELASLAEPPPAEQGGVAPSASTPLVMADGVPGELRLLPDPPALDFATVGLGPLLLVVASAAALWAVLLAMAFARSVGRQMTALADTAERVGRGEFDTAADGATSGARDEISAVATAHRNLARSLEERNRQIADLAQEVAALPIGEDPVEVAHGVVRAAARVTGESIWTLAVLQSTGPDLLPPGRYGDGAQEDSGTTSCTELDRAAWHAVGEEVMTAAGARLIHNDAGTCVAALVAARDDLRAVLIAPWAGRAEPSAAELALFGLLGQHAGTAIGQALLYARLRVQAAELEQLAGLQGDFLRGVTHDLQTPLTSIAAISAELGAQSDLAEPAVSDLRSIGEQAERLRRMVSQLLTVSRLGAGPVQPRQEVIRPGPLVLRTWQALRPRGRRLELEPDARDHLVIADPDRLEQVLWALLDNAVKYGGEGSSVTVRLRSHRRTDPSVELQPNATPSDLVGVIEIADEGIGMDAETAKRAFDQFYRAPGARSVAPDGSGVGLYAARGLVLAMGGTIRIASTPGAGTTVTISLPAEPVAEVPGREEREMPDPATPGAVL